MEPLPEHLGHKPVFSIPYEQFDGIYAGKTDVKYLSVGLAQYNANSVSAKTMRHTGGRWTRQAEELPLHRVVDLSLFIAQAIYSTESGETEIPAGTFDNQRTALKVVENENRSTQEIAQFHNFMEENGDQLKHRLNALADVLIELRESGKI